MGVEDSSTYQLRSATVSMFLLYIGRPRFGPWSGHSFNSLPTPATLEGQYRSPGVSSNRRVSKGGIQGIYQEMVEPRKRIDRGGNPRNMNKLNRY